jgi:hypothetical protein
MSPNKQGGSTAAACHLEEIMTSRMKRPRAERRRRDKVIFIERRKGKAWMYGQISLFVVLLASLLWLTRH